MSTVGLLSRVMVLAGCLGLATLAIGQDQPAPKATKPAAPASPEAKEFQDLFNVRVELEKKLVKLQGEIAAAAKAKDLKQQQELIDQFNGLISDFETKTLPKLVVLAGPLFIKDDSDPQARSIVLGNLQDLYHHNKYKNVIAEGNKYLEAGRKHPLILNFVGVSYFALQDFVKAEEILKQAKAAGAADEEAGGMFAQIGAPFLGQCRPYLAMWKKEVEIRAKEAAAKGDARLPRVLFKTTKGDVELELFENEAPNTVANFISLVEKKYYDGIAFHRVIPNFMAQGGDPLTKEKAPRGNIGTGGPGYHIACECFQPNARMHFQGSLSMAKSPEPNTGGSQFFLTSLPTPHLNPDNDRMSGHTVFGRIVKGMDVALGFEIMDPDRYDPRRVDRIQSATVIFKRNHPYVPKTSSDGETPAK